ncbi:hypothetical protein C5167_008335 [Papaver somniferum]|uniref:Knottin scorpion toxin-like domain-containing protein n=1 Tax=Papaver somniferum TaxID=3469 RepID=A0A4Y7JXZ1_PAPSO|nr:hypothetical protein C5167_008335 [Papaver somniferum]
MKFTALISLLLLCLVLSNTGIVAAYWCEKALAPGDLKGSYERRLLKGPCPRRLCSEICYYHYLSGGKCYGNQCKCSVFSKTPCA